MAVTIHSNPSLYTPSDNPVTWVFSSDQTAQPNFVYVVTVIIDSVEVSEHLVFPEVGARAHFDAMADTRAYVNPSFIGQTAFNDNSNNFSIVALKVQERYGSTPALEASTTSSNIIVFKSKLSKRAFIDWDYTEYSSQSGTKFMTDFPSSDRFYLASDEDAYLSLICDERSVSVSATLYDSAGGSVATDSDSTADEYIQMFNVGQTAIIADTSITQANFNASAYYEITVTDGANTVTFTVWIDRDVISYPRYQALFMNRFGAIDSFAFTRASTVRGDVAKKMYQKQFGGWNGTSFEYSATEGEMRTYFSTTTNSILVNSDWISEDVQHWLTGLYGSTLVWVNDGDFIQLANIRSSSFEKKQHLNQFVVNEQVEIELSLIDEGITI